MRSDSETIRFLRDRVKCGECGYPMTRTLQSSCKIKERWTCTNPECGCRVRISDSVLIEKVTMLINRIIENFSNIKEALQALGVGEALVSVLDEKGKVDPTKLNAFVFDQFQSGYYAIGEKVGQAWHTGAPLMKKQ